MCAQRAPSPSWRKVQSSEKFERKSRYPFLRQVREVRKEDEPVVEMSRPPSKTLTRVQSTPVFNITKEDLAEMAADDSYFASRSSSASATSPASPFQRPPNSGANSSPRAPGRESDEEGVTGEEKEKRGKKEKEKEKEKKRPQSPALQVPRGAARLASLPITPPELPAPPSDDTPSPPSVPLITPRSAAKEAYLAKINKLPPPPQLPASQQAIPPYYNPCVGAQCLLGTWREPVFSEELLQSADELAAIAGHDVTVEILQDIIASCELVLKRPHIMQHSRNRRHVFSVGLLGQGVDAGVRAIKPQLHGELIDRVNSGAIEKEKPQRQAMLQDCMSRARAAQQAREERNPVRKLTMDEATRRKRLFEKAARLARSANIETEEKEVVVPVPDRKPSVPPAPSSSSTSTASAPAAAPTVVSSSIKMVRLDEKLAQLVSNALAQLPRPPPLVDDTPELQDECGASSIVYQGGDMYKGPVEGGVRRGEGEYLFANGLGKVCGYFDGNSVTRAAVTIDNWLFEGNIENGVLCGECVIRRRSAVVYKGNVENGLPHGAGEWNEVSASFCGEFCEGKIGERGVLELENGQRFEGTFENSLPTKGVLSSLTLGMYSGQLKDWMADGRGELFFQNGDQYAGAFERGMRHGKGRLDFANGQLYCGEFRDDQKHGKGLQAFPNGDSYEGEFAHNLPHGVGEFNYASKNTKVRGNFSEGKFVNRIRKAAS